MIHISTIQSVLSYCLLVLAFVYKNVMDLFNVVYKILVRVMLNYYNDNYYYCTDDLFKMLKIATLEQLYGKMSIMELHKNKSNFKY